MYERDKIHRCKLRQQEVLQEFIKNRRKSGILNTSSRHLYVLAINVGHLAILTLVALAIAIGGTSVSQGAAVVTTHELRPGQQPVGPNNPSVLMPAIMQAYNHGAREYVIPHGIYKLPDPHGGFYLSFSKMRNFRIIGKGVTLLRTDPTKGGILFNHCRNVTLTGVTLRCDPIPYTEGTIIALGPHHTNLTLRVCKGYAADITNPVRFSRHPAGTVFRSRASGYQIKPGNWNAVYIRRIQKTGPRKFRISCLPRLPGVRPGDMLTLRSHIRTDVKLFHCRSMCIIRVTVMGGTGMCFREEGGEGGNRYVGDRIIYPTQPHIADVPPLLASNADGFHSGYPGVRHGPTLIRCHFEGTDDDGITIHGAYAMLAKARKNFWIVRFPADGHNFIRLGDRLKLYGPNGGFLGEVRSLQISKCNDSRMVHGGAPPTGMGFNGPPRYYSLLVSRLISGAADGDRIDDIDADGGGFLVRDCVVKRNVSRGLLIKADNGVIEDNTIDGSTLGGIEVTPEIWADEAGCSCNLLIVGNTIRNVGRIRAPGWRQAGALSVTAAPDFHSETFGHRGIIISGNHFVDDNGINVLLTDASGVIISENYFVHPMRSPNPRGSDLQNYGPTLPITEARVLHPRKNVFQHFNSSSLIYLQQCKNILLTDNHVIKPGPAMKLPVGVGPDVSDVEGVKSGVK